MAHANTRAMGFLSRKSKSAVPVEERQEDHPIVEELQEMEQAVPSRDAERRRPRTRSGGAGG